MPAARPPAGRQERRGRPAGEGRSGRKREQQPQLTEPEPQLAVRCKRHPFYDNPFLMVILKEIRQVASKYKWKCPLPPPPPLSPAAANPTVPTVPCCGSLQKPLQPGVGAVPHEAECPDHTEGGHTGEQANRARRPSVRMARSVRAARASQRGGGGWAISGGSGPAPAMGHGVDPHCAGNTTDRSPTGHRQVTDGSPNGGGGGLRTPPRSGGAAGGTRGAGDGRGLCPTWHVVQIAEGCRGQWGRRRTEGGWNRVQKPRSDAGNSTFGFS